MNLTDRKAEYIEFVSDRLDFIARDIIRDFNNYCFDDWNYEEKEKTFNKIKGLNELFNRVLKDNELTPKKLNAIISFAEVIRKMELIDEIYNKKLIIKGE